MALEEIKARISLLLEEMVNQPEDRTKSRNSCAKSCSEMRAMGLPLPADLVALEKRLDDDFLAAGTKPGKPLRFNSSCEAEPGDKPAVGSSRPDRRDKMIRLAGLAIPALLLSQRGIRPAGGPAGAEGRGRLRRLARRQRRACAA